MSGMRVKVERAKLSACLTCPLCHNLFRKATTISECLHTFCRECITKKLTDEKLKRCPECNAYLGCSPLDKLRADHNLQDLRDKLLPGEGKTAEAPPPRNDDASNTLVTKTKKLSLCSSKANAKVAKPAERKASNSKESDFSSAPRPENVAEDAAKDDKPRSIGILDDVSTHISARKAKAAARKKFIPRQFTPTCQPDNVTGNDEKKDDDLSQLQSSNETSKTRVQKNCSKPDSSRQIVRDKIPVESDEGEPLNSLVKAARKNKSCNKSTTMQGNAIAVIPMSVDSSDSESSQVPNKVAAKKHFHHNKASGDQSEPNPSNSDSVKLKKLQGTQERAVKFSADLNVPAEPAIDSSGEADKGFRPIWFSLVASEEKEAGAQLPQIPSSYLRIKDGTLPVSFIKKYIVRKLDLASESEVEITMRGTPILPWMQLQEVVEMWLQTKPVNEKVQTNAGDSAKDFVMVLSYGRAH